MATTALSTLLPLLQLPRCPQNTQLQALRHAARKFCLDTEVWREDLADISAVDGTGDYVLASEYTDAIIHRVTNVELDDADLAESVWSYTPGGTLTLDPEPVADGTLVVSVVYVPDPECAALVDWLVQRWGDAIAAYAAARLKSDPQSSRDPVPWHDPTGAALAYSTYTDGVASAKASVLVGGRSGEVQILHPPFYL